MLPGPNYIYKCPNCGNLLKIRSLMSGNTIGAKVFSDGKSIAPMLPEFPNLTKCKKCDKINWLSKLKEIGTYKFFPENLEWLNADEVKFLEIDEYFDALKIAINSEEELYIRQRIWWTYNDRIRQGQNIFNDEVDEIRWKENVNNLINLFDKSDINQKIMIAEIYRNLGEFENCIKVIESIDKEEFIWLKEKFVNESNRKNRWVVQLN